MSGSRLSLQAPPPLAGIERAGEILSTAECVNRRKALENSDGSSQ
jgi:hypothetical protein